MKAGRQEPRSKTGPIHTKGRLEGGSMSAVKDHLERVGIRYHSLAHERTYTALDEAGELHVEAHLVLKTIALVTDRDEYAFAAVPADRRLDLNLAREALGARRVHLATEKELARDLPFFELGAIPPVPDLLPGSLVVDADVLGQEGVVFPAGTETESLRVNSADLFLGEKVTIAPLTQAVLWAGEPV
jgi:prolyl-tRNA editing enzyme YbaK/EbsC (Cys-tRNA(Pro) deacylase)